jgi:hypothetical protein
VYQFIFKSHVKKWKENRGIDLHILPTAWVDMRIEGVLVPGHVSHTFLCFSALPQQSTFDPLALFVSAVNLHHECPPTLLWALMTLIWITRFGYKDFMKRSKESKSPGAFKKISLGAYQALHKKVHPKQSLLSVCQEEMNTELSVCLCVCLFKCLFAGVCL